MNWKNRGVLLLFLLVIFVLSSQSVDSKSAIQVPTALNSLTIVYPQSEYYSTNTTVVMPFDVLNSNYSRLDNTTATCLFFAVDNNGYNLTAGYLTYNSTLAYWYYQLNNNDTSTNGNYPYYVHCNSSQLENGFVSSEFEINKDGIDYSINNNTPLILGISFVCLMIILLFSFLGYIFSKEDNFLFYLCYMFWLIALLVPLYLIRLVVNLTRLDSNVLTLLDTFHTIYWIVFFALFVMMVIYFVVLVLVWLYEIAFVKKKKVHKKLKW